MPYFIYGSDAKTGTVAKRVYSDAPTEADARLYGESLGLSVTNVVLCRADQNPALVITSPPRPAIARRTGMPTALETKQNEEAVSNFNQSLDSLTPTTYVTYAILAINILMFAGMVAFGANAMTPKNADLLKWGGEFGMLTVNGQWWRLFTAMFVHAGILHLAANMYAFVYVGHTVERMFGNMGFLAIYLASGLAGGLLAMFLDPMQVHIGASGAIFGIYGALLAMLLRERDSIPTSILQNLKKYVIVFILYNLVNSIRPNISMAAHVGGLVVGFLCGLMAAQPLTDDMSNQRTVRNLLVAGAGILVFAIGAVAMMVRYPNLNHMEAYIDGFGALNKQMAGVFKSANDKNQKSELSDTQFADTIDHDMLPLWRNTRSQLDSLPTVQSAIVNNTIEYVHERQDSLEALSAALRDNDHRILKDAQAKEAIADRLSSWAK